jgi:hypothetical protein
MVLGAKVLEKPAEIEPWFENLAYYGARAWPHLHQLFYRSLAAVVVAADALQLFEQVCPEDGRPRKALQLAINWLVEPSIRNMRLAFSEGFVNCGADVGALDSALALFKDGHELAERAANAAMAIGSASIMNGPGQEQEMKPFLEEAQLALGHGDDCWKTIFRPKICHIMISYALYGWRNFQSLLPAHPFEKNWK